MGIKFKATLNGEVLDRIVKSLGSLFKTIIGIRPQNLQSSISIDMFRASYLSYEASRTYRTMMAEFERKRACYLMEVQRQSMRTF